MLNSKLLVYKAESMTRLKYSQMKPSFVELLLLEAVRPTNLPAPEAHLLHKSFPPLYFRFRVVD